MVLVAEESHTSAVEEQKRAPAVAEEQISPEAADQISLVEVVQSALAVADHNA